MAPLLAHRSRMHQAALAALCDFGRLHGDHLGDFGRHAAPVAADRRRRFRRQESDAACTPAAPCRYRDHGPRSVRMAGFRRRCLSRFQDRGGTSFPDVRHDCSGRSRVDSGICLRPLRLGVPRRHRIRKLGWNEDNHGRFSERSDCRLPALRHVLSGLAAEPGRSARRSLRYRQSQSTKEAHQACDGPDVPGSGNP